MNREGSTQISAEYDHFWIYFYVYMFMFVIHKLPAIEYSKYYSLSSFNFLPPVYILYACELCDFWQFQGSENQNKMSAKSSILSIYSFGFMKTTAIFNQTIHNLQTLHPRKFTTYRWLFILALFSNPVIRYLSC